MIVLKTGIHGVLILGIVGIVVFSVLLNANLSDIREAMVIGMTRAMPALFILLMIGVVIVTFTLSGTIPSLVYYGITLIHPSIFLPSGLILCSIMSLVVGTSWGTVGTGGIVLIGIGSTMGIPAPVIAGMVISGASFGDKMSPISDTTNMASIATDVDLYDHIKSMMYTTFPSFLIALIVFSLLGVQYSGQSLPTSEINIILHSLESNFTINILMLLPLIILFTLSLKGTLPEAAMLLSSLAACFIAVFIQDVSLSHLINSFYQGANIVTHNELLDKLLNKGGIYQMAFTFTMLCIAIVLGAILDHMKFIQSLMSWALKNIQHAKSLVISTIFTTILLNALLVANHVATLLVGKMFKNKYKQKQLNATVLSRSLEEGGTLITPLIPWTPTAIFYTATLGVSTNDYIMFALLNWINPLVALLFAIFGIAQFRTLNTDSSK